MPIINCFVSPMPCGVDFLFQGVLTFKNFFFSYPELFFSNSQIFPDSYSSSQNHQALQNTCCHGVTGCKKPNPSQTKKTPNPQTPVFI